MKLRAYEPGDADRIALRAEQHAEAVGGAAARADAAALEGQAYTIERDGQPIACGGFLPQEDGSAIAWGMCGAGAPGFALARLVRRVVLRAKLPLLVAHVRADFLEAAEFVWWLGFAPVGKLQKFGPDGMDYWLYRRIAPLREAA